MKHSTTNAKFNSNSIFTKIAAAAAWLLLWQLCCVFIGKPLLFPSPVLVLKTLFELMESPLFWQTVFSSLCKVLLAFGLAVISGSFLATLASIWPLLRSFLRPPMSLIRATPVASFTMLVFVWLHSQWLPVLVAYLMVLPMVYENVCEGIASTDTQLLEMAQVYRLSFWKKLRFLYLPAILPFFTSACINGMGFAWKSSIAAEIIGLPTLTIGKQIHDAKIYVEIPQLFAWTLVVILLSILLEKVLLRLMKWLNQRILLAKEGKSC